MGPLSIIGAILIGVSLGLTGAGGSVITLPVLVYLAGLTPEEAVGMSLFVVGAAATVGALQRIRAGEFHRSAIVMFASAGAVGAMGGAKLTPLVPGSVLMLVFALLMLVVAVIMLLGNQEEEPVAQIRCQPLRCLGSGLGVGLLTGFIGVGGGFLLMPALVHFGRLPMRTATGTSLAIVAINSFVGFVSHLGNAPPRWGMASLFAVIAVTGVLFGNALASRLPIGRLQQIFAFVVLVTGLYVLWRSVI